MARLSKLTPCEPTRASFMSQVRFSPTKTCNSTDSRMYSYRGHRHRVEKKSWANHREMWNDTICFAHVGADGWFLIGRGPRNGWVLIRFNQWETTCWVCEGDIYDWMKQNQDPQLAGRSGCLLQQILWGNWWLWVRHFMAKNVKVGRCSEPKVGHWDVAKGASRLMKWTFPILSQCWLSSIYSIKYPDDISPVYTPVYIPTIATKNGSVIVCKIIQRLIPSPIPAIIFGGRSSGHYKSSFKIPLKCFAPACLMLTSHDIPIIIR